MEQFKKWYKRYFGASKTWQIGAKQGWKAALKCVRDEMLLSCYEPIDIYDFINEELGDETM